jgi:hypothetical protein
MDKLREHIQKMKDTAQYTYSAADAQRAAAEGLELLAELVAPAPQAEPAPEPEAGPL